MSEKHFISLCLFRHTKNVLINLEIIIIIKLKLLSGSIKF